MMRIDRHESELTITLEGAIDATNAYQPYEEAVAQFEQHTTTSVVVELADVTFADSTAIGMLVRIRELADRAGAEFWLQHVPARLANLLQVTGLGSTLRSR